MYLGLSQLRKATAAANWYGVRKRMYGEHPLYIGPSSEVYFCIYEKDYGQYKKHDIPIADAEGKEPL